MGWSQVGSSTLKGTFKRQGGSYSGSDVGKFNVRCGSTVVETTLVIHFHVTKAKAINGEWRATKFVGTLEQSEASQLGCVASHATMSINGSFLG